MEKINVEMKNLKVIYVGQKEGVSKSTNRPYSIRQAQVEQTLHNGIKQLHMMTIPVFNAVPVSVGDVIDAQVSCRAASGVIYLDLTSHVIASSEKIPLKAVAGGGGK